LLNRRAQWLTLPNYASRAESISRHFKFIRQNIIGTGGTMTQDHLSAWLDGEWSCARMMIRNKVGSKECEEGKIYIETAGLLCFSRSGA